MNASSQRLVIAAFCVVLAALAFVRNRCRRASLRRRIAGDKVSGRVSAHLGTVQDVLAGHRRRRAARSGASGDLAALLDAVARRCASGHSLTAALTETMAARGAPPDMASVTDSLHAGAPLAAALATVHTTNADVRLAVHVLWLCATQGGGIAESLDRAAATLRERQAARDERSAHAAQARLSAKVLTVVPMLFATWTTLTTDSVRRFATTVPGFACITGGVALNLAGWSLMQRSIRSVR